MPTINQLPVLNTISSGDQLPVYSPNNGDARRTSIGSLLTYFQQTFASPTLSTNLYVPATGFNITVPTPVSNDQWMLLQPAGTLATGTITLPLNTGVPDGTTVLITTTQDITSLTIALNGATALFGSVVTLGAGTATAIRFYQATNSWYQINAETTYAAGVQSFLGAPSSANLRAAMTDETGTGSLVFATGPTITGATLTTAALNGTLGATTPSTIAATSINKMAITAPATSSTLAVADGKTLTANNSLTLAGTDGTTQTFPATSATIARTDAAQTFTGTQTFGAITTTGNTILGDASTDTLNVGNGGLIKDASGNVGIGATPSAYQVNNRALDIYPHAGLSSNSSPGTTDLSCNAYNTTSQALLGWRYKLAAAATLYQQSNDTHTWQVAPVGAVDGLITFVERMKLDGSGIVTMSAYGAGTATFSAAGVISSVSDETWKIKDGVPLNPDAMLMKLTPGYWFYNDEKKELFGAERQLGFYAQNVNSAIGVEAAPIPEEGKPWGYYDRSVLAVTVMSLQKALTTIDSLTARLELLEAK